MIFTCKGCGGNVIYDPEKKQMFCPYCDGIDSEEIVHAETIGICPSCGGEIPVNDYTSASKCSHCGNYSIFEERVEGQYEPHLILPFKIGKSAVKQILKESFQKKVFLPSSFLSEQKLEGIEGMYVPFWLYDYLVHYNYEGKGTKTKIWRVGNTEYTEKSFFSIKRDMDIDFERIPIDASIAMEDGTMDLMEPYGYKALEQFHAKYMSGFFGEIYNENADVLEERAKQKVTANSEELLMGTIQKYDTIVPVKRDLSMQRDGTHYALMPVWIYIYRYRDKTYRLHINGQTGKVIGETPISKGKVVAYGSTLFVALLAIASLAVTILEVL